MRHSRLKDTANSSSQRIFTMLLVATMIQSFSDLVAALVRGTDFPGARFAIQLSNLAYFESITACAYFWYLYAMKKLKINHSSRKKLLLSLPAILFSLAIVSNPMTSFLFSINEQNLYVRGKGVVLHWIVSWFYLIYATIAAFLAIRKEKSRIARSEIMPLVYFIIAPSVAAAVQMAYYGITSSQVGITISIFMICLSLQDNLISQDELTGICNRKELNRFVENTLLSRGKTTVIVSMLDINSFKKINDTYGHSAGDFTLIATAKALKRACSRFEDPLFLCRYGGDEFVIIGPSTSSVTPETVRNAIRQEIQFAEKEPNVPCPVSVSIGSSVGICETLSDFDHHLRLADESMYDDKKQYANTI